MKKYVTIGSQINIRVTRDIHSKDLTNKEVAKYQKDTMHVDCSEWVGNIVMLYKGNHSYPACIKDWGTVKELAKNGVITIGAETDEVISGDDKADVIKKNCEKVSDKPKVRKEKKAEPVIEAPKAEVKDEKPEEQEASLEDLAK